MSRWVSVAVTYFILQEFEALGIFDRLIYGEWVGKSGDKLTQLLNLLFLIACGALFLRGFRRIGAMRTRGSIALYLTGFLFASAAWSINPSLSIREAVLFAFVMVGSVGVAANLEPDEFMGLLARACLVAALATLALYAVAPHTVISAEEGDFRGIFSQKNVLGQAMMVGSLAYLHRLRVGDGRRSVNLLGLAILGLVCVMSRSTTSCLTIATMSGFELIFASFRKGGGARLLAVVALLVGVPALIAVAAAPDALLELMGKDPTLTGRTDIWAYVMRMIAARPVLGWGYYAFWTTSNPYAIDLADIVHWFVPQSHNGLLEIALDLGLVGAAMFIFLLGHTLVLAIRCMRAGQWSVGMSTFLICVAIVQLGVSEMVLIGPFQATTPPFFVLGLMCERALREARRRPRWQSAWFDGAAPGPAEI